MKPHPARAAVSHCPSPQHPRPHRLFRAASAHALAVTAAAAGLLLSTGCAFLAPAPDPVRHFSLGETPLGGTGSVGYGSVDGVGGDSVGAAESTSPFLLRPVVLAGHLRNRALATRIGTSELLYDERVRWAEPLDEAITARLRARLHAQLTATAARATPAAAASPHPQRSVTVRIECFELVRDAARNAAGGRVELIAEWSVAGAPPSRARFHAPPRVWDGRDLSTLVAHLRDALDAFAQHLAADLAQTPEPTPRDSAPAAAPED